MLGLGTHGVIFCFVQPFKSEFDKYVRVVKLNPMGEWYATDELDPSGQVEDVLDISGHIDLYDLYDLARHVAGWGAVSPA